jgi:hypothetical protein
MKKVVAAVFLAVLFLAFSAQAADELAGLSGTWILDKEKSDAFPRSLTAGNASGVGDVGMGRGGMGRGGGGGGFPGGEFPGGGGARGRSGMGGPGAFTPPPLTIEQNGDEVKLITKMQVNGKEMPPFIETFVCDGKQHEEMVNYLGSPDKTKQTTKATLKKDKFVVERVNFSPPSANGSMQTLTKRTYALSKDGKTMTLETAIQNTMMSNIQKQVYNRQ